MSGSSEIANAPATALSRIAGDDVRSLPRSNGLQTNGGRKSKRPPLLKRRRGRRKCVGLPRRLHSDTLRAGTSRAPVARLIFILALALIMYPAGSRAVVLWNDPGTTLAYSTGSGADVL